MTVISIVSSVQCHSTYIYIPHTNPSYRGPWPCSQGRKGGGRCRKLSHPGMATAACKWRPKGTISNSDRISVERARSRLESGHNPASITLASGGWAWHCNCVLGAVGVLNETMRTSEHTGLSAESAGSCIWVLIVLCLSRENFTPKNRFGALRTSFDNR